MPRQKRYGNEKMIIFSIRLPATLKREIERLALQDRRSVNQEIVLLLERGLQILKEQAKAGERSTR